MSVTVPFRLHRHAPAHEGSAPSATAPAPPDADGVPPAPARPAGDDVPPRPPRRAPSAGRRTSAPERGSSVRLGHVGVGSAAAYLLLWAVVLFVVEVLVFWLAHTTLTRLGVLESVSRAAATVLDQEVPAGGVLPALELDALLPPALAVAAALAVLWLLTSLSLVLVHNCICSLTGGPRVRLR